MDDYTILAAIFDTIYNVDFLIIECFEEFCLLIMSKDFRSLVKKQFFKSTQNTSTTVNLQNSQRERMRQLNVQHNNFINNS